MRVFLDILHLERALRAVEEAIRTLQDEPPRIHLPRNLVNEA
jgi:hypothetical protein